MTQTKNRMGRIGRALIVLSRDKAIIVMLGFSVNFALVARSIIGDVPHCICYPPIYSFAEPC